MRYAPITPYIGNRPIQEFFNPSDDVNTLFSPAVLPQPMGALLTAVDPYWGTGEFMYVRANGSIRAFGLVVLNPVFNTTDLRYRWEATEVPNTANLGRTLGVAIRAMSAGQYGWIQVGGVCPVNCQAAVAADTTFGIAAAGQGGANSAGKQILNARVVAASSTTVAKTGVVTGGSTILRVTQANNIDGWFIGAPIAGTGIPASSTIAGLDPDARTVTLSAAATASGGITATVTYNDGTIFYNVAHINRPFAQGAIT
jgi:hypothetical protein